MKAAVLALLLLGATGCVTEEVVPPAVVRKDVDGQPKWVSTRRVRGINEDPKADRRTESELRAQVAATPKSAKAWYRLGEFYERNRRNTEALAAYQTMQDLIAKESRERGTAFVGGLYLVAKMHAVLGEWSEAALTLGKLLKHKPRDLRAALSTPSFREAHYLLGAIYFRFENWKLADEHLRACLELGGDDPRLPGMLSRCERELQPVTLQAKARSKRGER